MSVTILECARARLDGREPVNGADFEEAGFDIVGGCQCCGACIAAYNAYPSKTGAWRCESCLGNLGFAGVAEALDFMGLTALIDGMASEGTRDEDYDEDEDDGSAGPAYLDDSDGPAPEPGSE